MVVVEAGFADGDDFGMTGERGEFLEKIHGAFVEDIARMESDHGIDVFVFLGDGQ